jgi:hypothetical protein
MTISTDVCTVEFEHGQAYRARPASRPTAAKCTALVRAGSSQGVPPVRVIRTSPIQWSRAFPRGVMCSI